MFTGPIRLDIFRTTSFFALRERWQIGSDYIYCFFLKKKTKKQNSVGGKRERFVHQNNGTKMPLTNQLGSSATVVVVVANDVGSVFPRVIFVVDLESLVSTALSLSYREWDAITVGKLLYVFIFYEYYPFIEVPWYIYKYLYRRLSLRSR